MLAWTASLVMVLIFGLLTTWQISRLEFGEDPAEIAAAERVMKQLLENEGDLGSTPPIVGLASDDRPYVINLTRLEEVRAMADSNYELFRNGSGAWPYDVLVEIYREDPSDPGNFEERPSVVLGTPLHAGLIYTVPGYAVYENGTLCRVLVKLSGG